MSVNTHSKEFTKHDTGKERFSLVPLEVIAELTKVLEYGAVKYSPDNWKSCHDTDRYFNALIRHLFAQRSGESTDKESGMLHLSHAFCNLAFMLYFEVQNAKKSKTPID